MSGPKYRVFILPSWNMGRRLYVAQDLWGQPHESGHGIKVRIASGFTWTEHCEGDAIDRFEGIPQADDLIQSIMDKGWDEGMRPRGFSDIKNETAALREHLGDMKKIAFHQLRIKD